MKSVMKVMKSEVKGKQTFFYLFGLLFHFGLDNLTLSLLWNSFGSRGFVHLLATSNTGWEWFNQVLFIDFLEIVFTLIVAISINIKKFYCRNVVITRRRGKNLAAHFNTLKEDCKVATRRMMRTGGTLDRGSLGTDALG